MLVDKSGGNFRKKSVSVQGKPISPRRPALRWKKAASAPRRERLSVEVKYGGA